MIKLEGEVAARFKKAESGRWPVGYQGINSSGYYGDYQIGITGKYNGKTYNHPEWKAWGGTNEEIGTASAARQLEIARVGFNQKQKSLVSLLGRQPEEWEIYGAWNIGEGNVARLIKGASDGKTLSQSGARIYAQAWGNDRNLANASCTEVLNRLHGYYGKGKVDATTIPNPNNPEVPTVVPGGDSDIGSTGRFGGVITLYLVENTSLKSDIEWTMVERDTPHQDFYVPALLAVAGVDAFIDIKGNIAPLYTDGESGMPRCDTEYFEGWFQPLALANNAPVYKHHGYY